MDIAEASASGAPWFVVGVLLGVAALLLAGLVTTLVVRHRTAARAAEPAPPDTPAVDDLPGFHVSPPGSTPAVAPAAGRHVALAAPPLPDPPPPPRQAPAVVAAAAALAVLLSAAAVGALTYADSSPGPGSRADRPAGEGRPRPAAEVRMSFSGLVLEQRAVGITATYPEVELTEDRDGPVARLTLPTWNCLSADAPDDPAAAGCVPSRTEYAQLRPPALEVTREGNGLRFGGEFPTSTRPTGSAPEPTGRTYPVEVTIPGDGDPCPGRRSAAAGVLLLGGREAVSVEGELRPDC